MGPPRYEFHDGFLQYLEEGDDHDDGEDEDSNGFEPFSTDGEFVAEAADLPLDEFVGCVDYEGAEEVEGGVDEGGD